jgi:hypothetical protein
MSAYAEVQVEGIPAAVRITTSQAAISDVLSAFAAAFNVKYRTAVPLNTAAHAVYTGSFAQVIARLLDGYSYVVKEEQETIEVIIFGRRGEVAVPPAAPTAPPSKGILSRWR